MKKVLILLLSVLSLSLSLSTSAQADSSKQYITNFTLQARDWEAITPLLLSGEKYEDMFQVIQTKYRASDYSGTTTVSVDSVRIDALIGIADYIRQVSYSDIEKSYSRIDGTIKAISNNYLQRQITAIEAAVADALQQRRKEFKRRLRGQRT